MDGFYTLKNLYSLNVLHPNLNKKWLEINLRRLESEKEENGNKAYQAG